MDCNNSQIRKLKYKEDNDSPKSLIGKRNRIRFESNEYYQKNNLIHFSSCSDYEDDQQNQHKEQETKTEVPDDIKLIFNHNLFGQENLHQNKFYEYEEDVDEYISAQLPYKSLQNKEQQDSQLQVPLKISLDSLYKYGKLRTDSEQVLPVVLKIESHKIQSKAKVKKQQAQGLDIVFVVDSRINKNELQMIDMKAALKILLNSVREEDRISVLIQTNQVLNFEDKLNENDLWKLIESVQEYEHAYNLEESVHESLKLIQQREADENAVKVVVLFSLNSKATPQIYEDIENNSDLGYFHFYQFGNYDLKNDLHCFNNLSNGCCTEIVYPQCISKQIPLIFDGSKENFIKNVTIQMTGSQYEDLQRTKFSQLYDIEMKQHNNFIGELAIDYLSTNQVYLATFDLLLPKCKENTQKKQIEFPVLEVSLTYTYQRSKFSDIKYLKINLLEESQIIPENNILVKPAILYYQQLVYRFLKQSYGKQNHYNIEIHNWIKNLIQRDQEVKLSLSTLFELMENRANELVKGISQ